MKKMMLLIFLSGIVFIGCKKGSSSPTNPSNPPGAYYFKATIDGTNVNYSGYAVATNPSYGTTYVYGYKNSTTTSADGILIIFFYDPISGTTGNAIAGIYTDTADGNRNNNNYWNPFIGTFSLQLSGVKYQFAPYEMCKITNIDNINSRSVSGTFSGNVSNGSVTKTITNGSFYVPF